MGLNSGEVVVGRIGDDLRMDYTAQGHTVGLAQRMEALAEPDKLLPDGATARLVDGLLRARRSRRVRGQGRRRAGARLRAARASARRARASTSRAPAASRASSAATTTWHARGRARAGARAGNGQVVGVVAEAGTGKSRLCFEFLERCRARGMRVLRGQRASRTARTSRSCRSCECSAPTSASPSRTTTARRARRSPAACCCSTRASARCCRSSSSSSACPIPSARRRAWIPRRASASSSACCASVIQAPSQRQPTVTLIEDLHWIDAAQRGVPRAVGRRASPARRASLLLNFRPEYRADVDAEVVLPPAPARAARPRGDRASCSRDLLGNDPSLAGLADAIHARTGGNPFFTEEVVQSLIESGSSQGTRGAYRLVTPVERLEVPATRAGRARGAHRSAAGAREAGAADRGGDRQGVRRAAARARCAELPEPTSCAAALRGAAGAPSSSTSRRSTRSPSTPSSIRSRRRSRSARSSASGAAQVHAAVARAIEAAARRASSTSRPRCSRITGRRPARRSAPRAGTGAPPCGSGAQRLRRRGAPLAARARADARAARRRRGGRARHRACMQLLA